MNNTEQPGTSSWERIQGGVRTAERLIGQKKYNEAMIKSRQTLEFMVKCLCEKSGIMEGSLIDMIDALYDNEVISKITCEHYHKIRTIGNKAIHEEDNSAYNANQAHHLLSQEVYTFSNDYNDKRRRPAQSAQTRHASESPQRRSASASGSRRRRSQPAGPAFDPVSLLKPLLLIAIIIVLIFIIKMIHPGKKAPVETTEPVTVESVAETPEETTEPETTVPAVVMYKTTDSVNVRSTPSTDDARIGLLGPNTEVEFVGDYDDRWCIIKYHGADAYVVKEYLTPVE